MTEILRQMEPGRLPPRAARVTADDWGLSRGVNDGIFRLVANGVVNRVSIIANAEHVDYRLADLAAIPGVELGMHLNLTHGRFDHGHALLRHGGPAGFLWRWLRSGNVGPRILRTETRRQLLLLREKRIQVSYFDSHHHVHLVPGVIDALSELLHENDLRQVRLPIDMRLWRTRKLPLLLLAAAARRRLERNDLEFLPCFYPTAAHFRDQRRLLATIEQLCAMHGDVEVIAHPAAYNDLDDLAWPDPYREERILEFEALLALAPVPQASPESTARRV